MDDFAAAAKWLVDKGHTQPDRIGAIGSGYGALLVTSAAVQHPDRFGAVVGISGPYDVRRSEWLDAGPFGRRPDPELGTVEREKDFKVMAVYRPLQKVRPREQYPAMFLLTGDSDDVVNPAHTCALAALLQQQRKGKGPVLMHALPEAGNMRFSAAERAEAMQQVLAFHARTLGVKVP